jgi:hypothetical protein
MGTKGSEDGQFFNSIVVAVDGKYIIVAQSFKNYIQLFPVMVPS